MADACPAVGGLWEGSTVCRSKASGSSSSWRGSTCLTMFSSLFSRACKDTSSHTVSLSQPKPCQPGVTNCAEHRGLPSTSTFFLGSDSRGGTWLPKWTWWCESQRKGGAEPLQTQGTLAQLWLHKVEAGGGSSLTSASGRRVAGGLGKTCSCMKHSPATLNSSSRKKALSMAMTHGKPARRSQQGEGSVKHIPPTPLPSVSGWDVFQEASPSQMTRKHLVRGPHWAALGHNPEHSGWG